MGFFTGQNYGYAKSANPQSYVKSTPKPSTYGSIKDWVHASEHKNTWNSWSGFKGDVHWKDNPHAEEGWFPVWYEEGEVNTNANQTNTPTLTTEQKAQKRADELSDPNSGYYMKIGRQIRGQLTGALSPDSLYGLTMAMGGSPTQAAERVKALQNKIPDMTSNLMEQYYLNASGQADSLLASIMGNNINQLQLQQNQSQYNQTRQDSLTNQNLILLQNLPNQLKDIFGNNRTNIDTKSNWYNWNSGRS